MGSEQFQRLGIGRSKEGALDYPEKYTVIGVDISADDLIKRYKGTKGEGYAADVIRAVVQKYRTAKTPPPYFVASLTGGVNEPVILCDLGPDSKGKSWAVVVDGRQRCLGLRMVNDDNAAAKPPLPRLMLPAVFRAFSHKGAGLAAAMVKAVSNIHVAMTLTQRADDALDLDGRGVGHEDIAHAIGARDADEVALLLCLAKCEPCVQTAVDEGRVALRDVLTLSALSPEEQARRVARKAAGPSKAAKNAAAAPRPKARPARMAQPFASELDRLLRNKARDANGELAVPPHAVAVAKWYAGDDAALDGFPEIRKALDSAEGMARGKAKPASEEMEAAE